MISLLLLLSVTVLYASYNLLVKVSSGHVPSEATSTILATLCLQVAALCTSIVFIVILLARGGHVLQLSSSAYLWALAAGLCIGCAEIGYFYLFGGVAGLKPMPSGIAIPVIVGGTVVISQAISYLVFGESMSWVQGLGGGLVVIGLVLLFHGRGLFHV